MGLKKIGKTLEAHLQAKHHPQHALVPDGGDGLNVLDTLLFAVGAGIVLDVGVLLVRHRLFNVEALRRERRGELLGGLCRYRGHDGCVVK